MDGRGKAACLKSLEQREPSSEETLHEEMPSPLSLVSLLPHLCFIDDVNLSFEKNPFHFLSFNLKVNGQNLPSSGFDRTRRFHQTFECGNQSRGHSPCAAG